MESELIGKTFGRLTIMYECASMGEGARFACRCSCGKDCIVLGYKLKSGHVKSCGCLKSNFKHITHGLGKQPTLSHWSNMKTRCFNKNNAKYKSYGARGITVCDEWLSFANFHKWAMSNGFKEGLTLERIDVNGNYCPENCTWIPMTEQAKNKRSTRLLTFNGVTDSILGWTKRIGCGKETIRNRINVLGWSVEKALSVPVIRRGGDSK